MASPGRPERNRAARSFRQFRRFHHVINSDRVFGTHRRSGNPLGRPPKSQTRKPDRSTLGNAYIAEAHRKLRITEAGKASRLKTIEIAVRRQGMAAVGGDLEAQREFGAGGGLRQRRECGQTWEVSDT